MNWHDLTYLLKGTARQQAAHAAIQSCRIMDHLAQFNPVLVGTIPINIDLPNSDLDIICAVKESQTESFLSKISTHFGHHQNFYTEQKLIRGVEVCLVRFRHADFDFEIFAQDVPVEKQYAYRHMVIEDQLLKKEGDEFRRKILTLKKKGYKTEPAFAKLLGLKGDPYEELLTFINL